MLAGASCCERGFLHPRRALRSTTSSPLGPERRISGLRRTQLAARAPDDRSLHEICHGQTAMDRGIMNEEHIFG